MTPKLSIVIPVYNEEKRLEDGFEHYWKYLKKQKYGWELILVDDGSQDQTGKLMKNITRGKPNVRMLSYTQNRGKGHAIVYGIERASGRYVLFTDIDHSVPINTIESFFEYFERGYKAIIGSRRVKGSKLPVRQPLIREFLGRGFTFLVNILIYWGISDSTCGFKAFENKIAKKIFSRITIYDWAFDAEIIFICKRHNIKFFQAPVTWSDVKGSRVRLQKDILSSLFGLFKIRVNDLEGKYL